MLHAIIPPATNRPGLELWGQKGEKRGSDGGGAAEAAATSGQNGASFFSRATESDESEMVAYRGIS